MNDKAVAEAVSAFGKAAGARLSSAAASGEPEDQLRGPIEARVQQSAPLCGFKPGAVVTIGESLLNVLGPLVDLEPQAADLLGRICSGPLISEATLRTQGVFFPEGHVPATAPAQQALDGF